MKQSSQGTIEVTCLVLAVNKTCCGLPLVARESRMTVTANGCFRNFALDFGGLKSITLLRKFNGCNLENIVARSRNSLPVA